MISPFHRRLAAALLATALATGALAGCSSGLSSSAGDSGTAQGPAAPAEKGAPAPGTVPNAGGAAGGVPKLPPSQPKSIVYNGDLSLRTSASTVDKVADQAAALATGAGGQIGSDQRSGQGADSVATIVLRVPATAFYSTVTALGKLGKETNRTVSSQDVSGQVVDLESRITTARASLTRTRALFARAQQIGDIVTLEQQLSDRETALETLLGQKKALDDQVSLSTVTVRVSADSAPQPDVTPPGFGAGLAAGWGALVNAVTVLLTIFGALLPFIVVIGVPVAAVWLVWRRRRSQRVAALAGVPASFVSGGPQPSAAPTVAANPVSPPGPPTRGDNV